MNNKKLMIVIEDTGDKDGFSVYLDGDKERLKSDMDTDVLSPAEYWTAALFNICQEALAQAGVISDVAMKPSEMN